MRPQPSKAEPRFLDGMTAPTPFCQAHPDRCAQLAQIAHLGGESVKQRYGARYLATIAQAGFQGYADKYFSGDRHAAAASLKGRGRLR